MSFTNSTPFAGPFGCALPGFAPNFSHAPGYHFAPTFAPGTPNNATPFNWFAPSPFSANFAHSPSPYSWNPTPWFANPATPNNFGPTSPFFSTNSFVPNNPAWFGHHAPGNGTSEFPNTPHAAHVSWPAYGWNQHNSFGPQTPSFAPATSASPWFTNPNFYQPINAAHYQANSPWISPAFGGSPWFAPHNWANGPVNPAWTQPGAPTANSTQPTPTPYAVATPPNETTTRDAA